MRLGTSIAFYPEQCCDTCNETIHTHMTCPACKAGYAGTDIYGDVYELEVGDILKCEECNAKFQLIIKTDDYSTYSWVRYEII